ncbi:MAG: HAD family phosphatase [Bacteroidetes bacterium]|nr:MAG: HAD family phosphatase [Bacteroidota bacterium]
MDQYEGIIFDLGGVILNIDYDKTRLAFEEIGLTDFDGIYSQASQSGLFDELEVGAISPQRFINEMLEHLPAGTSPNQVVSAWNAMLLDLPKENLDFLKSLHEKTRTFLLSNTNEIHLPAFHSILENSHSESSLDPYFEKVYYSCRLRMRKPDPETFLKVCEENGLNPQKTFFVDDSIQHVEGARKAGLIAHHLRGGERIQDLFT